MTITPVKRALLSVSDKSSLVEFATSLHELGVELVSTGGTSKKLTEAGIPHREIDDLTKMSEMLGGRVKTLHPKVHGGILGKRDTQADEAAKHGIEWIDMVVVNFYPFAKIASNSDLSWDQAVEYIDIGGPTMVRAAAKNFAWVGVVTDPLDYDDIIKTMKKEQGLPLAKKEYLAQKAFAKTSQYDTMIHEFFQKKTNIVTGINLQFEKITDLRYGENPHQKASAYRFIKETNSLLDAKQHQGKPLSYNNILDAEAALACVREFSEPTCVVVKHANPCGVASSNNINDAYTKAYMADAKSAFGGIVALNRACTKEIAESITSIFMEVVIAPSFDEDALTLFANKPNLRILELPTDVSSEWEMRFINGGLLMQEKDQQQITKTDLQIVTEAKPSEEDLEAMLFSWRVLKHVKSNGILLAKNMETVGVGAGQVSRIDAVDLAIKKAQNNVKDSILASDAFFPFRDSIDTIAKTGVKTIIQPGGSVRDEEVIAACNEHGIAMVFTGKRCFKH